MRLTAQDIRQQQFAVKLFRGFDPQEVDAFLEEMADDFEELARENNLLKEQLGTLEERTKGIEGRERSLHETLVTTQKIAEDFKENARREAELILREAQLRSEKFAQDARDQHGKLSAEVAALQRHRRQLAEEILRTVATYKRLVEQEISESGGG